MSGMYDRGADQMDDALFEKSRKESTADCGRDRVYAHNVLDRLWRLGFMSRTEVYKRLSIYMGKEASDTHISLFNKKECERVVSFALEELKKRGVIGGLLI